jgi:hypothetical protein
VFDLASAPQYIALSYTWGPASPSYRIFVNDQPFEVRDNLYNFLLTFQTRSAIETDIIYLYIDQICINQSDIPEKCSQVVLMSSIYTRAALVVVWLGNNPETLTAARSFENDMEEADELYFATGSLKKLLSNPYFTRVWIVQEVSLARDIRVLCGDMELGWETLRFGVSLNPLEVENRIGTLDALFAESNK